MEEQNTNPRDGLRLSKSGVKDRKLWYENNVKLKTYIRDPDEDLFESEGANLMRFLIGHSTEALLMFLAREAGHTIEYEQAEVEIEGVLGHCDCVIDGHLVDIKTASMYGYAKFLDDKLVSGDDPFGYIPQLSSYKRGLELKGVIFKEPSYFWAYNKSNSDMTLLPISKHDLIDPEARIRRQKEVLEMDSPPEKKCYEPVPNGKAGNMMLDNNCHWCPYKFECWDGLRTFEYAKGPVHFTDVQKEPKVQEIFRDE